MNRKTAKSITVTIAVSAALFGPSIPAIWAHPEHGEDHGHSSAVIYPEAPVVPWTQKPFNNDPEEFQFAIIGI